MPRMNLKTSFVLIVISIFLAGVANQVQAHPPCGAGYHSGSGYGYGRGYVPQMLPPTGATPGYWRLGTGTTTTITIERK